MEKKYFQPEIETMPVEELLKLQEEKLIKQVKYVYENNKYYKKLMDEKGVKPEDVKCRADLAKLILFLKCSICKTFLPNSNRYLC